MCSEKIFFIYKSTVNLGKDLVESQYLFFCMLFIKWTVERQLNTFSKQHI